MLFARGGQDIFAVDNIFLHPRLALAAHAFRAHCFLASTGNVRLVLLVGAVVLQAACPAFARGTDIAPTQAPVEAPPAARGTIFDGHWSDVVRSTVQNALAPVYVSVTELLRPAANARLVWGSTARFESFGPDATRYWRDFAEAFGYRDANTSGFALQRAAFSPDQTGVGAWLNPRRFRIPWLLAPESVMHAMPTLSMATFGSFHADLMAASIGGRAGSSAVYGQLVYRF